MAVKASPETIREMRGIIANAILFSITQGYMNTGTVKC